MEGEEEVKGRTLGNAGIQDEERNQRRSSQSNHLKFSRLSQEIKKERGSRSAGHHRKRYTEVRKGPGEAVLLAFW